MATHSRSIGGSTFGFSGRYLVRCLIFLVVLGTLTTYFFDRLQDAFFTNPGLNGTILGLMALGIVYTLKGILEVLRDRRAADRAAVVTDEVRRGIKPLNQATEVLLTPTRNTVGPFLATVHRIIRNGDTSSTLPYLLDSLATRAEDRRALVRFLTGTLILLGLIGTFYGLLITIGGVRGVIGSLSVGADASTLEVFSALKERLATPLGGMALAFSSSLFGLVASLILAFVELQLLHAQNDLQARLETLVVGDLLPLWQPRAVRGQADPGGEGGHPRFTVALLQTVAERLDRITASTQGLLEREAAAHARLLDLLTQLGGRLEGLRDTLDGAERDRTGALREEIRLLGHVLAQREQQDHAPPN